MSAPNAMMEPPHWHIETADVILIRGSRIEVTKVKHDKKHGEVATCLVGRAPGRVVAIYKCEDLARFIGTNGRDELVPIGRAS